MHSAKLFAVLSELGTFKLNRSKHSRSAYTSVVNSRLPIVIALGTLLFFGNLAGSDIYILDEAKNASCAREMLEKGDWIVPTFNDTLRAQKPPLHYNFMALGYRIFGVNELGARFFSAVFGWLTVVVLYLFTKRFLSGRVAFIASLVFLSSLHMIIQFRLAVPDPYLIFFVLLSIFSFYAALAIPNRRFLWLAYSALGLAVLAKGPVALVIVGGVMLLFLLYTKAINRSTLQWLMPFYGIGLFLLIVLPWYIAVSVATDGEWLRRFVFQENVNRFMAPMEGHGGPWWLMAVLTFTGMLPFSFFIGPALYRAWKQRSDNFLIIAMASIVVVVGFFSVSGTKLPTYIGPSLPFVAIILGYFLDQLWIAGNLKRFAVATTLLVYSLLMIGLPIGVYLFLETQVCLAALRNLSFFFIIIPLGGIVSWLAALRQNVEVMIGSLVVSWVTLSLIAFFIILPQLDKLNPVAAALEHIPEHAQVVSYKRFHPAFAFYWQKPIIQYQHIDSLQKYVPNSLSVIIITDHRYSPELDSAKVSPNLLYEQSQLFEPIRIRLYAY